MARINRSGKKAPRTRFAGIPHSVLNHCDFIGLSGIATKLLIELARQYNGHNNGNLCTAFSLMTQRGFNSKSTLTKCINELIDAKLLIRTREGRFTNPSGRCALYALAWQPINECKGKDLEVEPSKTPPRAFSLENQSKSPCPKTGQSSSLKSGRHRLRDNNGRFTSS